MRRTRFLGLAALLVGIGLAQSAKLRAEETHTLKLAQPMVVAGVNLRPAVYDLQWEFQGTHATVKFSRKGRVVATVEGESAVFDRSVPHDTIYFSKHPDGFLAMNALGFASTNKGIVFPVFPSRRHRAPEAPVGNSLLQESFRNPSQAAPRVSK